MIFNISHKPVGLARPRFNTKSGHTYNCQKAQMVADKFLFAQQMRSRNDFKLADGPLMASVTLRHQLPQSWSQKRKDAALNGSYTGTPDIDNCVKYYFDVLNGIAYSDDKFISHIYAEQIYAEEPGVEIKLHELSGNMIEEKVLSVDSNFTLLRYEDINQLVMKANRLGLAGRALGGFTRYLDEKGCHYTFQLNNVSTPPSKPLS